MQGAEEKVKKGYASPNNLEEANKLVSDCKVNILHRHIIVGMVDACFMPGYGLVKTEVKYSGGEGDVW